nr:hypothetical protein [Streptomyces sp. ME08-AFT2]
MIARRRVGAVLAPDGGSIADEKAAPGPRGPDACSVPGQAAKAKSQVPVWREGLAWSVLSMDYQRILQALADRHRLHQGPRDRPGKAARHEQGHRPVDHRLGAGGAAFEVACQAAGAHQVSEEPLDDPPLGQHHEAAHVVAAFDDRQDQPERAQAVLDEAAGLAADGPDQLQLVLCVGDLP